MTVLLKHMPDGCGCDAPEHTSYLISLDEALRRVSEVAAPVGETERLVLGEAFGRTLGEPVRSRAAMPPFDNAAMDGYAIDAAGLAGDGPWTFDVSARVPAGQNAGRPLATGAAARIFTGAPLPKGADTVVMQEQVQRLASRVRIDRRPDIGANIRRAGSEMAAGETVVDAGHTLGSREIAACAAAGAGDARVRRRIRVALLVTGDEIRTAGATRSAAQIWDTNTPMLCAELARPSVELVAVEHSADCRDGLKLQLARMAGVADLVVTSGGSRLARRIMSARPLVSLRPISALPASPSSPESRRRSVVSVPPSGLACRAIRLRPSSPGNSSGQRCCGGFAVNPSPAPAGATS
ncbi:MAG: molybdopterin molybdotransferase MoeA [Alphaproteobacteria bacterium]|nr:molybdopterin molybdotransferase MoeA [Alphaproteobacteria bacterium]